MARRRTKRVALRSPYLNVLHFHIVGQPFLLFQNIYLGLHIIGFESRIRADVPHELQALQGHYLAAAVTDFLPQKVFVEMQRRRDVSRPRSPVALAAA